MKAILILLLLCLTFSYKQKKAYEYAIEKIEEEDEDDNYQEQSQNEENAKFVSKCMFKGGENFKNCEGKKDIKGRFLDSTDLKNCLDLKKWNTTDVPKKGNPVFLKNTLNGGISHAMIIGDDLVTIRNKVLCCTIQPKKCTHYSLRNLIMYKS